MSLLSFGGVEDSRSNSLTIGVNFVTVVDGLKLD